MSDNDAKVCERCGAFGDIPHGWVEGDCVLPHRNHSRRLAPGSFICEPCIDRHREWLTEIVELYAALGSVLLAGSIEEDTNSEYQKPRKAPASPSPLRLTAWALLYGVNDHIVNVTYDATGKRVEDEQAAYLGGNLPDVPAVLAGWAQLVYDIDHGGATAPDTVAGAAAALRTGAHTIAGDPSIDDYDAELGWLRRSLRNAHGINSHPIGPCLNVSCRGRVWPVRGERPRCDRCKRSYTVHEIVRLHAQQRQAS